MGGFRREQEERGRDLRAREDEAKRKLAGYERAGEKGLKDVARRKEVLKGEIERIEGEIGGLERGT